MSEASVMLIDLAHDVGAFRHPLCSVTKAMVAEVQPLTDAVHACHPTAEETLIYFFTRC